jgi:hypothetical protein
MTDAESTSDEPLDDVTTWPGTALEEHRNENWR